MDIILNWRQACAALSISRPTLYSLTNQGKLTRVRISKGRVGWPKSEINRYIESLITNHKG
ncbi:MAG: helix-turn-helix transcriptional regulator [Candidatus Puniceispirillaceae bacterium]